MREKETLQSKNEREEDISEFLPSNRLVFAVRSSSFHPLSGLHFHS
uniref:Uncharacterized protein n=1 Tax=Cucumis melo subsp. melo TaxID=412675 RepID=E5GCF7_CUCME|nr:hypothetical protein [Cucumis melo subsp. melo]